LHRFDAQSTGCARTRSGMPVDTPEGGKGTPRLPIRRYTMLHYALVFLVVALIAAALGFGGIAGAAAGIAKLLFLIFIVLFLVSLLVGGLRRF
jgi:uncharacterized membrane protein YtjA (UPF0391 family)